MMSINYCAESVVKLQSSINIVVNRYNKTSILFIELSKLPMFVVILICMMLVLYLNSVAWVYRQKCCDMLQRMRSHLTALLCAFLGHRNSGCFVIAV